MISEENDRKILLYYQEEALHGEQNNNNPYYFIAGMIEKRGSQEAVDFLKKEIPDLREIVRLKIEEIEKAEAEQNPVLAVLSREIQKKTWLSIRLSLWENMLKYLIQFEE